MTFLHAQPQPVNLDDYDDAVRAFVKGGHYLGAVERLMPFTSKDFDAAAQRIAARQDRAFIEAAAVFQLEIGIGILDLSPNAASGHFALGRWLLQHLMPASTEPVTEQDDFRTLAATWYVVAGSAFLAIDDTANARVWLERALEARPNAAAAHTLLAAAHEMDAAIANPDVLPSGRQKTRTIEERQKRLALAEASYRKALASDPLFVRAEIRLGRLLFLRGDFAAARATFASAEPRAVESADRYLLALSLGASHQQAGDHEAARAAYARALQLMPDSQTAVVALSYLESIAGRPDRAQLLVRAQAEGGFHNDRPWWEYRMGGVDEPGLSWLRARVRR